VTKSDANSCEFVDGTTVGLADYIGNSWDERASIDRKAQFGVYIYLIQVAIHHKERKCVEYLMQNLPTFAFFSKFSLFPLIHRNLGYLIEYAAFDPIFEEALRTYYRYIHTTDIAMNS
jgi:hypothetical protein